MNNGSQMEYCENKTLRQLIDSDELHTSEDKVWRLLREIAEGLEHIHSKVREGCSHDEGTAWVVLYQEIAKQLEVLYKTESLCCCFLF